MAQSKPTNLPQKDAETALNEVIQAWQEGHLVQAEKLVRKILSNLPDWAHAWFVYAQVALARNQPKKAMDALEHLTDAVELTLSVACLRGRCHLTMNETHDALKALAVALDYKPDDPLAHHLTGLAHGMNGDPVQAKRFFKQAVLLTPEMGPAHYELGVLALQAQDASAALIHCTKSTECMPDSPQAWNNLSLACSANGQNAEAVAAAQRAVSLAPAYAEAWFNLSLALASVGQATESAAARAKAIALAPALNDLAPTNAS